MLPIYVETPTGHYKEPGQVGQGANASSFPIAPPSTVRGFLESFAGASSGSFDGEFAYGRDREPTGFGLAYQKVHVWATGGLDTGKGVNERVRTINVETYYDVSHIVLVRGPWEERVRAALRGDVNRFGVLYLGRSIDIVTWLDEYRGDLSKVEWVTPGQDLRLIVQSSRGYDSFKPKYERFALQTGEPHWFR